MTNRIAFAMLFTTIGAAVATVITAVTAAAAFVFGAYFGSKMNEESKTTEK